MDVELVQTALDDWQAAPIDERLRATLGFLQKLTLTPMQMTAADVEAVLATGVTRQGIEDAVYVCYTFNILTRLADAFDFDLTTPARWQVGGRIFHWFGYGATSLPG